MDTTRRHGSALMKIDRLKSRYTLHKNQQRLRKSTGSYFVRSRYFEDNRSTPPKCYVHLILSPSRQVEGTHRVRMHAINVKMNLLTLWPWPLTFQPQIHVTSRISQGHFLYQMWTLWDHSFLSYADKQADRQTDRQTNKQTNRRNRKSYPHRPTMSWVIMLFTLRGAEEEDAVDDVGCQ